VNDLVVRRIPFNFDNVEVLWNPSNPSFSMMMNSVTFQAIGFEKYLCLAMRDAEEVITDPAVLEEARIFRAQESVHSNAHRVHAKALIARYPGLQDVLDESIADFEAIHRREDLHFHLAYGANIEATFTPLFGTIIEHRKALFGGGDPRVAALMLWHFCEEIEHRSSALKVYNHVVGNPGYRTKQLKKVLAHIGPNARRIGDGFKKHLPEVPESAYQSVLTALPIPFLHKARMILGILESQVPWHNPDRGKAPSYYNEWRARYEQGQDMSVENTLWPAAARAA
jgi:predicted metal-dependent hydrolase